MSLAVSLKPDDAPEWEAAMIKRALKIVFRDFDNAWFRVPLGVDFLLRKSPLNLFFELVPSFNFSDLKLFGAIGFRTIFER
jgi:hypothetical protein